MRIYGYCVAHSNVCALGRCVRSVYVIDSVVRKRLCVCVCARLFVYSWPIYSTHPHVSCGETDQYYFVPLEKYHIQ